MRKRFYINGKPVAGSVEHAPYLHTAHALLDMVKQRMKTGNLQQLAQQYTTETGVTLRALSRFGQDEIWVDVPQSASAGLPRKAREYCVWGPTKVAYSQAFTGVPSLPITDGGPLVYFGIADPGDYDLRAVVALDADTLVEASRFSTTIRTGPQHSWALTFALEANRATWGGNDFGGSQENILEQWQLGTQAVSSFNCSAFNTFGVSAASFEIHSTISQALTKPPLHVLNLAYSDEAPPWESHNAWIVINTTDNATVLQLVDPSWGMHQYLTTAAHITPLGDTLFVHTPSQTEITTYGHAAAIHRYGTGRSGITATYPLPDLVDSYYHGTAINAVVVVLNDDATMYLRVKGADLATDVLYTWSGSGWTVLQTDTPLISMPAWERGIVHDPITDAVAALDGDGSGAWIFNGKDCFGATMPPFYVPFTDHPQLLHSPTSALVCETFLNGVLYVEFINNGEVVIGKIDIGRLRQKKQTEQLP